MTEAEAASKPLGQHLSKGVLQGPSKGLCRPRLYVMLKAPAAGRVKTRLGREIGMVAAAWWFRHQVRALLRRLDDPRWELVLAVAPDGAVNAGHWPAHLPRVAQGRGDLGARMARLLRRPARACVCHRNNGRDGTLRAAFFICARSPGSPSGGTTE